MVRKIQVKEAITYEYPPDGGQIPIIDPYDGCTIGCPYCFQLNDNEWNKNLNIKMNISELIPKNLVNWPKDQTIYIGSKCDPYMDIEEEYGLTRQCIIELSKLKIPIMITTKSNLDTIFRDIDILQGYNADLTVLLGMSNLSELSITKDLNDFKNIKIANRLHSLGIKIWAFITPILPGITDIDSIINSLHSEIPVFLDELRINISSKPGERMLNYITEKYPHLKDTYESILYNNRNSYIDEIRVKWIDSGRVNFVFD